ncbi:hypothetical protein tloyanaT_03590 [Thalassotalea loyana]|uniref:Uncharacterized protein n=1 Tax=Thalassotalea loyana TaxID=280483 RepID=A0ABQ6HBE8_9GAMM|nr:hypothetical protein tloyanaT_03590 [Thalassotalea loyana]
MRFIKQLILGRKIQKVTVKSKDCNYSNNYYGDRICVKSK